MAARPAGAPSACDGVPARGDDAGAVVVGKAYDLALWLLPRVESFPRSLRVTLGDRIADAGLDVVSLLTEAAYTREKGALLAAAQGRVNALRMLLRSSAPASWASRSGDPDGERGCDQRVQSRSV